MITSWLCVYGTIYKPELQTTTTNIIRVLSEPRPQGTCWLFGLLSQPRAVHVIRLWKLPSPHMEVFLGNGHVCKQEVDG